MKDQIWHSVDDMKTSVLNVKGQVLHSGVVCIGGILMHSDCITLLLPFEMRLLKRRQTHSGRYGRYYYGISHFQCQMSEFFEPRYQTGIKCQVAILAANEDHLLNLKLTLI